jgi:3-oxoacyl-[acyl-carrier-protein] synthase-1
MGIISSLGTGSAETFSRLFDAGGNYLNKTNEFSPGKFSPIGQVKSELPQLTNTKQKHHSRNNRMLLAAYQQIEREVGDAILQYGQNRVAVIVGTSTSGISETEVSFKQNMKEGQWPETYDYGQQDIGSSSQFLAEHLDLHGICYTISTACSSGAKALAAARRLLEMDMCDAVIAGGVDTLCQLTIQGFSALDAMSADLCNPFSKNRNGINIGEGAALFLLTKNSASICLRGVGETSDAHHISAPDPDGDGAYRAMVQSLEDASIDSGTVDYINLHGTATAQNDAMESKAVFRLFGRDVLCSSTKPLTGHCLGASGAIEAGICWLLLNENNGRLPIHPWDGIRDEELSDISFTSVEQSTVPNLSRLMSNSFAFGGSNISLLLERHKMEQN